MHKTSPFNTTRRAYRASDYFILILPSSTGLHQVLSPDFKIEVSVNLPISELPRWLAHIACEMESEINRRLASPEHPNPRPRTLKQIFIQKQKKLSTRELAQTLGVSQRSIQMYRKSGLPLKKGAIPPGKSPLSHLDYPLVIGRMDQARRVFSPDFRVGKTLDPTVDFEKSLGSAIQTVLTLAAKAFESITSKPVPSNLRPTHQITAQNYENYKNTKWLTSSEMATHLGVSAKTILRKYRSLATITPGGHLRWPDESIGKIRLHDLNPPDNHPTPLPPLEHQEEILK